MASRANESEMPGGAQSVRRAIGILRLVAAGQDRGVRLTDVATAAGLAPPTVHRLLKVLMDETTVEQDAVTRRYRIGNEITLLGLARPGGVSIRAVAEPYLTALAQEVGDTVFLSVQHGGDSVCIARYLGSSPIQVLSIDVGARRPLGASVSGVALLAGLTPDRAAAHVARNEKRLQAVGRSKSDVIRMVESARRTGHVYAPKGVMQGTTAVAVPVRDSANAVVAAVSIATLAERLKRDRVRQVLARMQEDVDRISMRLGEIECARARRAASPAGR